MNHISDEELTLLYYGEETPGTHIDAHVGECAECRERYESLRRVLGAVEMAVPERGPEYWSEVWSRIELDVDVRRLRPRKLRRWAVSIAAALVLLLGGSFQAGRFYQAGQLHQASQQTAADSAGLREATAARVLRAAVGDYLERSQIVLIGLANADPNAPLDISLDQERARDLVSENRLYRQTAERTGQAGIASLLEDLERVLLEIEHAPPKLPPEDLKQLRHRLKDDGILFKMRVMGANVEKL
jgi:hypothetical protein